MLLKILALTFIVFALLFTYAYFQPSAYTISRSIIINASPEALFPYINSAQLSFSWMPWKDMDNQIEMTYDGPNEGVGSKGSWKSKGKMGVGESTIIESIPNKSTQIKIIYTEPFEMNQISDMTLIPVVNGTKVQWGVKGNNNAIGRFFCLFSNLDKMVGTNFELGLEKLKSLIENNKANANK